MDYINMINQINSLLKLQNISKLEIKNMHKLKYYQSILHIKTYIFSIYNNCYDFMYYKDDNNKYNLYIYDIYLFK